MAEWSRRQQPAAGDEQVADLIHPAGKNWQRLLLNTDAGAGRLFLPVPCMTLVLDIGPV